MRMKPEEVVEAMLEVEKIFEPRKQEWNTVYIAFSSGAVAEKVIRHTKYMKKGKGTGKVQHYVPKELYARYSALEKKAAEMRIGSNRTINTTLQVAQA